MRFAEDHCPTCGLEVRGTSDTIPGSALLELVDETTREYEHTGETEVFWDGQMNVEPTPGLVALDCRNGHEWTTRILDDPTPAGVREEPRAAEVVLPTEREMKRGVDAWELLPDISGLHGKRVRITVEILP